MTENKIGLLDIISALLEVPRLHRRDSALYKVLAQAALDHSIEIFGPNGVQSSNLGPMGELELPFQSFGSINSVHLFGIDELIIFAFYFANRSNYRRVADIGANIGLHSVILSKLGYNVHAFEPDPTHLELLEQNLERNGVAEQVVVHPHAVSVTAGSMEFVRLLGNTTGSHLAGSKPTAYGAMEKFMVPTESFSTVISSFDLIKLDVEGHELEILGATTGDHWTNTDAIIEVGSKSNAVGIFEHFSAIGVNLFSQKIGWNIVSQINEMPTSHREGSLFISKRSEMLWGS